MMKRILCLFLVIGILCGCNSQQQKWQEQYDLGMRYLSEGNYEEAILAFSAAIEIDPNRADAYVLRGDAYVMAAKEDPDKADKYLRKARKDYEKAEELDPDLAEALEEKWEYLEEVEADQGSEDPAASMLIPEEAFVFDGHSYMVFEQAGSWEDAQAFCQSMGGHLAVITSQEENDAVHQYILGQGYASAYIGLTDSLEEGTWVWINGETSDYQNWNSGEPNGENPNEDYAMFYYKFSSGTWNDGDFGGSTVNGGVTFVCEWDGAVKQDFVQKNPDLEKQYSFDTFLAEKTYLNYWTESGYTPAEYALVDLNADGQDELIIISNTDNGFFVYQIYFYHLETGEIQLAVMDSANPGYFYGTISHSPSYKALVVVPMNVGSYGTFLEYHVFDGKGFTYIGTIGRAESTYYNDLNGADQDISQEEFASLRGETVPVSTTELP